jgi:hypothetical protein
MPGLRTRSIQPSRGAVEYQWRDVFQSGLVESLGRVLRVRPMRLYPLVFADMNRIRITGLYLLIALIILAELSISEMKRGSGRVDFSFIILLPFAIGLLCNRKWRSPAPQL